MGNFGERLWGSSVSAVIETPTPTHTGMSVNRRTLSTTIPASAATVVRSPVTPMRPTA